jgi:hypothetical protein
MNVKSRGHRARAKEQAMNGPNVAARLLLPAALLIAACGVQPHPTVASNGHGGSDVLSGAGGATGQAGTETSGMAGSGGPAGTSGAAGTMGAGGSIAPTGRGGTSGPSGSGGQAGSRGGTAGGTGAAGASGTGTAGTGGSGTSGAGITINGTFVPKEKAITFIHFGHSNMRGQATKPSSLMTYFYSTQAGLWSYKGSFTLAKEPTAPEGTMTLAGPGMAILHSAQGALQAGSDAQIISIGYGKGSVTTVDYATTGVYYPIFMNWAQQLKGKVTFAGIVVMLGITERHLPTDQIPGFPARMAAIIASIRNDLGEPNLPVLFCDYEQNATGDLAPTGSVGTVIQPLVRMLPQMVPNLVLVPTDGLSMQDDHHFDMQGHKDWSDRVIMLMKSNGWWHW